MLVAGGGVAGVAAAVAAARAGCRTLLLERAGVLGGTAVRGLLPTLCGLYANSEAAPTGTLNGGLGRELAEALQHRPRRVGKVWVQPCEPGELQQLLTELCRREALLTVRTGTAVVAAAATEGRLTEAMAEGSNGRLVVRPRAAVDATGEAELARLAGAATELAPAAERQLAGYIVRLRGVGEDEALPLKVPLVLAGLAAAGKVAASLRFTTFAAGAAGEGYLKLSLPAGEAADPALPAQILALLAGRLPALAAAELAAASDGAFQREGRRIVGDYRLTAEDVLAGRAFPDAVAANAWPMEVWDRERGTRYRYPPAEVYQIPEGCLRVRGFANLLAAGRCISAEPEALASTRVVGCCLALGEQAGRLAARTEE